MTEAELRLPVYLPKASLGKDSELCLCTFVEGLLDRDPFGGERGR